MTDPEVGTGPGDELSRSNAATDRRGLVSRFRGRGDFAGIAALVALVFAYLSPALKDGGAFGSYDLVLPLTTLGNGLFSGAPHNALSSDGVSQMIAWNAFDWRAVHHLQFPLWNDLTLLGVPHFANFESAVLSLPDVVSYLAPLKYAFLVAVAVKLLLAGTGTYAFCRVLGLRPLASTFGGATFMLSGAFSSWLTWPLSDVMSWTGWIATLCVLSYRLPDRRRYVALLAGATAFCLYGGFPEAYVFVMVTMAVLFGVASAFALFRRAGLSFSGVLRVAFGVGAGGMLATPLLLPGLQVINLAHRETESGFPGAPARSLAMAVAPGYYGLPIKGSTFFLNRSNYYETAVAIGVVALVLAVVAVLRWPRHPAVVALVLASVVALAVSYQTSSFDPVQSFLNHHGLGAVEWLRMRLVLGFTIGVLAAIGLETVTRLSREKRVVAGYLASAVLWAAVVALLAGHGLPKSAPRALRSLREQSLLWPVATVGVTAVAGALLLIARGRRRPRRHGASFGLAGIAATVLTGTQAGFLIFSGVGLNSYSHAFYPSTPAISRLQSIVGTGLVGLDTGDPTHDQRFQPVGFYPDVNLAYGVALYGIHDPLVPQLYYSTWQPGSGVGGPGLFEPDIDSATIARRYGIGWIIVAPNPAIPAPAGTRYVATLAGERLYSVPGAARFGFVGAGSEGSSVESVSHPVSSSWTLGVDARSLSQIVFRVTDVPGWHATIDGRPLELSTYGGLMLRAAVPPGRHTIHLWYLPSRLVTGELLALVALVGLATFGAWPWLIRRRRASSGPGLTPTRPVDLGLSIGEDIDAAARSNLVRLRGDPSP